MTRQLPTLFVLLVAAAAAAWRLVGLTDWPSPFHPTLQYDQSALAARWLWVAVDPAARTPDRVAWWHAVGGEHVVSPPVLPALVAGVYALTGEEVPWVSRLFTTAFWLAAGAFVRAAALRLTGGRWAAALAFAWFVLTPFGVKVSRSFQTEPVLALGLAAAVWSLARLDRPTWRATLAAGCVCGAAAFAKPGVLFAPLVGGFAGVLLSAAVPRRLPKLAAFTALTVLPSAAYGAVLLRWHVGNKVIPELLLEWWYYESVEKQVAAVIGYGALGLAVAGVGLAASTRRFLLPGLFAGYVGYLGIFTLHCATHDYYHVPLEVLTAAALAVPLARLERRSGWTDRRWFGVALAALAGFLVVTRNPEHGPWRWTPSARAKIARRADERDRLAAAYRTLGEVVGPGAGVIVLGEAEGYAAEYHAGVRRAAWPRPADRPILQLAGQLPRPFDAGAFLRELVCTRGFDYFVVTDLTALEDQPELRTLLGKWGQLLASGPGLLIYDLRSLRTADPGAR